MSRMAMIGKGLGGKVKAIASHPGAGKIGNVLGFGLVGIGALGAINTMSQPAFRPDTYKTHLTNNVMAGKIKLHELNQRDFNVVKTSPLIKKLKFQDEAAQ